MKAKTIEYFGDGVFLEPLQFEDAKQRRASRTRKQPAARRWWTLRRSIRTVGSRLATWLDRVFLPLNTESVAFGWIRNDADRQVSPRMAGLDRYFY